MINIGALRDLDTSPLTNLNTDLAVAESFQTVAATESVLKTFGDFNTHIENFLEHVHRLLYLVNPENDCLFDDNDVVNTAHQINRSLFEARNNLNKIYAEDGDKDLFSRARGIYSVAHNYYYQNIRPQLLSFADLDLPNLDTFAQGRYKDQEQVLFTNSQDYFRRYRNAMLAALEYLVSFEEIERPTITESEKKDQLEAFKELSRLVEDLGQEAQRLLPKSGVITNRGLNKDFRSFTEALNEAFWPVSITSLELQRILHGKTVSLLNRERYADLIHKLISNFKEYEDLETKVEKTKLSDAIRIILLLYLMRLQTITANQIGLQSSENFDDKFKALLQEKIDDLANSELKIVFEQALNLIKDPYNNTSLAKNFIEKTDDRASLPSRHRINNLTRKIGEINCRLLAINPEYEEANKEINAFYQIINSKNKKSDKEIELLARLTENIIGRVNYYARLRSLPGLTKDAIKYIRTITSAFYHCATAA